MMTATNNQIHNEAAAFSMYKLANAPLSLFPFPHFYLQDVFPPLFYKQLISNLPPASAMLPMDQVRLVSGYKERFALELNDKYLSRLPAAQHEFWRDFASWFTSNDFASILLRKFAAQIKARFSNQDNVRFYFDSYLVQDITNYSIGPHTDSPRKVISALFYLPQGTDQISLGTSIYLPKQANFTCEGGPHHDFANFTKLYTVPFLPNSAFVFVKNNQSFHGVEPITTPNCKRWVLLLNAYADLT